MKTTILLAVAFALGALPAVAKIDNNFIPFCRDDLGTKKLPFRLIVVDVGARIKILVTAIKNRTERIDNSALVVMTKPAAEIVFDKEYFERKYRDLESHRADSVTKDKAKYAFIVVDTIVDRSAWKGDEWNLENHYYAPLSSFVTP